LSNQIFRENKADIKCQQKNLKEELFIFKERNRVFVQDAEKNYAKLINLFIVRIAVSFSEITMKKYRKTLIKYEKLVMIYEKRKINALVAVCILVKGTKIYFV